MDKILQTQLVNIYERINAQEEEIEMAARLLAQATGGEGEIHLKTFHDFTGIESYLKESSLSLPRVRSFESIDLVDTPDRILVVADAFDDEVKAFVTELSESDTDFVLISNYNKHESRFLDTVQHYIDLSSPRPLVPTPNFDKIVNPCLSAFLYLYNHIYVLIDEMTNEDY